MKNPSLKACSRIDPLWLLCAAYFPALFAGAVVYAITQNDWDAVGILSGMIVFSVVMSPVIAGSPRWISS